MANKYLRQYLTPSATTETEIYTAPAANNAVLSSLRVTNDNSSVANISAAIYPAGGSTPYKLLKTYVLPPSQTLDILSGVPCVLIAGDVLKVTSSVADVDFYLSYLEIDRA
jgi:hypothetical protein